MKPREAPSLPVGVSGVGMGEVRAAAEAAGTAAVSSQAPRYRTLVVDPPWKVMAGPLMQGVGEGWAWDERQHMQTRPLAYPTMTVEEMAALPVGEMAAPDSALFLWTINAYVEDAYDLARAWGFKPSTLCVWAKNPMGGGLGGAFGITTEFFLYARRGSPLERRVTGTWFNWKRHYINGKPAHSAKPDAFYDLVESVTDPAYVELFARRARLGWDYWGDESLGTAEMPQAADTYSEEEHDGHRVEQSQRPALLAGGGFAGAGDGRGSWGVAVREADVVRPDGASGGVSAAGRSGYGLGAPPLEAQARQATAEPATDKPGPKGSLNRPPSCGGGGVELDNPGGELP